MSPLPLLPSLLFQRDSGTPPQSTNTTANSTPPPYDPSKMECPDWESYVKNVNNCQQIMANNTPHRQHDRTAMILQICIPIAVVILLTASLWQAFRIMHKRTGHYYPWLNQCWREGRCQEVHAGAKMKRLSQWDGKGSHSRLGSVNSVGGEAQRGRERPVTEVFPGGMRNVDAGPYRSDGLLHPDGRAYGGDEKKTWYGVGVKDMQLPPRSYERGSWRGV